MTRSGSRRARGRRRALAALGVTGVLLAAAVLAGPRLVPGDRIASRVAEAATAATGARVTVADASLTLVGGPGLRLRGVSVDAQPAWEATLESVEVSLAIAPLLGRRLVVDRVALRGPRAVALAGGRRASLGEFEAAASGLNVQLNGPEGLAVRAAQAGPGTGLPADLRGKFTCNAAGADFSGLALAGVEIRGQLERGDLRLESFAARGCGGRLSGSGVVGVGPSPRKWEASLDLDSVAAAELLAPWAPSVASQLELRLAGEVRGSGELGALVADQALPAALALEAHLGAGDGLVRAGPWLAGAEPYLGDRQDLVDIRLSAARVAARLEGGRCLVDTLRLRGPDTDWDLAGVIELGGGSAGANEGDGAVDLSVHIRLPAGFTPQLGAMTFFAEAMRDGEGRVNLDLALRGPLPEPVVNLDLAAMSRRVRKP